MKMKFDILPNSDINVIFTRESDNATRNVKISQKEFVSNANKTLEALGYKISNDLTVNEYQTRAKVTCIDSSYSWTYLFAGAVAELGELADKIAKMVRHGDLPVNFTREDVLNLPEDKRKGLLGELGDIKWFSFLLDDWFGWCAQDVAQSNLDKLADRARRHVIDSSGDFR